MPCRNDPSAESPASYLQDGKNGRLMKRGPFPFVVQLRDLKTRELLPGRTIQDIGPKAVRPSSLASDTLGRPRH